MRQSSVCARLRAGAALRLALAAAAVTSGASARAQDAPPVPAATDQQAPERQATPVPTPADQSVPAETTGQDIVVTGSRLQAAGFTAPTPTTVLGSGAIALRAPVSVSEVVNRLPAVRNSVSPNASQRQFGGGTSPVDLRGLGPVRTLTLVDGNRFTPTLEDGTVDTSLIPVGLIERIDVVTGGASAAYGSDAVAGVVNFVLAKKLQGVRLAVQAGVTERGDGASQVLNLAAGTAFAGGRGHIIAGVDATRNEGVGIILEREFGRRLPGQITYGANRPAGTPALGFETGVNYSTQSVGGLITAGPLRGQAFAPDGSLYPFQYGTVYSNLMVGGSNPGSEVFHWPIQTPVDRVAGLARVEYELSDAITAFVSGSYGWTRSNTYTGFNQSSFVISRDNAFLPAATRAAMVANNLQTITVGRLLTENGGVPQRNTFETWRAIGGLTGTIGSKWSWDASAQYGESNNEFRFLSQIIPANYRAAVNAVRDASGNIVCGPLATNPNLTPAQRAQVQPGCVPINIFGQGAPSAAALAYIGPETYHDWTNTRLVVAGNLRGSPIATWAGDVQIAIGGEARRDELTATSDPYSLAAIAASGNYGAYRGRVNVTEFYGEIGVPLARDWSFAKSLEVNGAIRRTDYSTSGAVTTWKAGVTYEPIDAIRIRGTLSRDIRAPNLAELFAYSGAGVSVNSTVNPFNNQTGALSTSTNGNPNLQPEVARTKSAGIVLQPDWDWARGLKLSVDYFDIDVRGLITQVAATQVIARCFAGETVYCPQIQFDSSPFGIANVQQLSFNLNRLRTRGLDFEVAYRLPLPESAGRLDLRVLATHVLRLTTYDRGTVIERAGSLANGGLPRWVGTADLTWALDTFTSTLSGRYTAAAINDVTRIGPDDPAYNPALPNSININKFPSAVYLDLNLQQRVSVGRTDFTVFGLVENLLDKDPPTFAAIGILTGNPYDLVGRRFKFGARVQF